MLSPISLALKTEASYRLNLRAAARALWLGEFNWFDFYTSAVAAIDRGFKDAWEEGAKTEGILPDELSDDELAQLEREIIHERAYIEGLADFIESQSKANGGKLATVNQRIERWLNTYSRVKQLAAVTAAKDKKKIWTLHPAEHCFLAGTRIKIDRGEKNIEDICVGDLVLTTHGYRKVTRVYSRDYSGKIIKLNNNLFCTPNHPVLTRGGWKNAKDISRLDNIVLFENRSDSIDTHISFPNSLNNIPASGKVFILSDISPFLLNLAFCKRLEPGMTMPVFPISLNNELSDHGINAKFRFNNWIFSIFDAKIAEYFKKFYLKFRGIEFRLLCSHFCESIIHFFFMLFIPFLYFINYLRFLHRIVVTHEFSCSLMDSIVIRFIVKFYVKFISPILNNLSSKIKLFSNFIRSLSRESFNNSFFNFFNFLGFSFWTGTYSDIGTFFGTIFPFSVFTQRNRIEYLSAYRTGSISDSFSGFVSAGWATEFESSFFRSSVVYISSERSSTVFTDKFLNHNDVPLLRLYNVRQDVLYTSLSKVYNLEVEEVNNYIANNIVVHNCSDCEALAGKVKRASYWRDHITPKDWALRCKNGCKCTLEDTDEPLSRGPLPGGF